MSRRIIEAEIARQFGAISEEVSEKGSASNLGVFCLGNVPSNGVTTLVTCGVSSVQLNRPPGSPWPKIRQEVLTSVPSDFGLSPVFDCLFSLAESAIENGKAFSYGETVKLPFQLDNLNSFDGFVCIEPPFWDVEETTQFYLGDPLIFLYAMPIFSVELKSIMSSGIEAFLSEIERRNVDIVDPARPRIEF
jgi:Suppressor of fused protein (SUFU)